MGKKNSKIKLNCSKCQTEFEKYKSLLNDKQKCFYCSRKCKDLHQKVILIGENNPNFNNKWSTEARQRQSEIMINRYNNDPLYRFEVGKSNRGKKFSPERIHAMHGHRPKESYGRTEYTDEIRQKIGKKSSERWKDPEYKKDLISKMLETKRKNGTIVKLEDMDDFQLYRKLSNWQGNVLEFITEDESRSIKETGMFNPIKNKSGLCRDHKFSRTEGFKLGVFPVIVRHPANLQLLPHQVNSSKKEKSSISLEFLFDLIISFNEPWREQQNALLAIEHYKTNNRWYNPHKKGDCHDRFFLC